MSKLKNHIVNDKNLEYTLCGYSTKNVNNRLVNITEYDSPNICKLCTHAVLFRLQNNITKMVSTMSHKQLMAKLTEIKGVLK